jgi:hypothetical protein
MTSQRSGEAANYIAAGEGLARAVCQCCGRRSRPVTADKDGEPDLFEMARGWSTAPFPADCKHDDGSVGSTFTCPDCNKRLHKGATLQLRAYMGGNLRMREVA